MKHISVIIIVCYLFIPLNIRSQECVSHFISAIQEQLIGLNKKEHNAIKNFMKVGYRVHSNLKLEEFCALKKPIYCIFYMKKLSNSKKDIRNLLCYLDTKRFYIDAVYFYKDSLFYGSATSAYINHDDQPISNSSVDVDLARIVLRENPEIIFTIGQNNNFYVFLKNDQLYVYSRFYNSKKVFMQYQIDYFINNYLDEADLIIGTEYFPSVYSN